jgi:hypothetical protein
LKNDQPASHDIRNAGQLLPTSRLIQNFPDFWKMEGTPSTPSGGPLGAKTLQINVGEAGVFTNIAWTIRNSLART